MKNIIYKAGIDEVGRGPVAGPVCVCAFLIKKDFEKEVQKELEQITDSKKLSEKKRYFYFEKIKKLKQDGKVFSSAVFVSALEIDKIGISKAIKKSTEKSFSNTLKQVQDFEQKEILADLKVFLDGGLFLENQNIFQETIIKGDQKEFTISCASVVAKCIRDDYMKKIALEFPQYEFEKHKGYGTKKHLENISKHGPSKIHRKTFLKKYL
ncbi:ribonuclease HII [Candidatus Campbellbacteria bacterium]|nr:MAG: ribonuclease HII [Candidatus Campbellbacteria bacterium]